MAAVSFAQALEAGDLSAIRSAPKADSHCHCYFGTRIERTSSGGLGVMSLTEYALHPSASKIARG